jgi:hypothetical protein
VRGHDSHRKRRQQQENGEATPDHPHRIVGDGSGLEQQATSP